MMEKQTLPDLGYDYGDLEPTILGQIMEIHHSKHHNAYVTNANKAIEQYAEAEKAGNLAKMVQLQQAIKFNGGGHINHSIFWTNLAPTSKGGGQMVDGNLSKAIDGEFGSLDALIEKFNATAGPLQGSGWCWLGFDPTNKSLKITTCANQDPLSTQGLIPLLGVDVWEHAYYLQYKNARPEYLKNIWKVINWKNVEERYSKVS